MNNGGDQNVHVIASGSVKDTGFLDHVPTTYAYIVKGVKYMDKWYYEKYNVTYFESANLQDGKEKYFNSLQEWNYFKANSTEPDLDFWDGTLFAKIQDRTKDPNWEEYGKTIWKTEEEENRPFIGMYEIVANRKKEEKRIKN